MRSLPLETSPSLELASSSFFWTEADVNRQMERIMVDGFKSVLHEVESKHLHPRMAAYTLAIGRVAQAMELRGLYP